MFRVLVEGMLRLVSSGGRPADWLERRDGIRLRCHYRVSVVSGERSFFSVVTDLGPSGLKLKFVEGLKPGDMVSVALSDRIEVEGGACDLAPVRCEVMWCRNRRVTRDRLAGLRYVIQNSLELSETWVGAVLECLGWELGESERQNRRWIRLECALPGRLQLNERGYEVRVRDLGIGGAQLQGDYDEIHAFSKECEDIKPRAVLRIGPWRDLQVLSLPGRLIAGSLDPLLSTTLYRFEFDQIQEASLSILSDYLMTLLREQELKH